MNQTLKKIDIEKVLFFDIETVRRSKELDINSREFELFRKKTRNRETDEYLPNDEVIELYRRTAALRMGYNTVVSIGVGFVKDGEVHIKALEGTEQEIITQFATIAQSFGFVCGANIIGFDLPMVVNNGYRYFDVSSLLPDRYISSGKKPWELKSVIDLMETFRGTHFSNSTLDEMCYHFDLPSPKTDLEGSQVSEEYWTNGINNINTYVKQDVLASINLLRKMRFEQPFETFLDKNDTFVEQKPLLNRIFAAKQITEKDKEELKILLQKKKPTKKEKEIVLGLIRASMADIDPNFGKVLNQKQIDEIINQLKTEI